MRHSLPMLALFAMAAGCIQGRDPPALPKQASLTYGPKIFLVDLSRGYDAELMQANACTRRGVKVSSSSTAVMVRPVDGLSTPIPLDVPHSCYVNVARKAPLLVDVVEVTNALYQLCADSGVCTAVAHKNLPPDKQCASPAEIESCPAFDLSQADAESFCTWIGRRLPSGLEHVIMRLGKAATSDRVDQLPDYPTATGQEPATCADAVTGPACMSPEPVLKAGDPTIATGGAANDTVTVDSDAKIHDLTGNVAEWSSDHPNHQALPWFCKAPLAAMHPPACDPGAVCVYGQYKPAGFPLQDWPVCIAFADGRSVGDANMVTSAFGGSFHDPMIKTDTAGVFARLEVPLDAKVVPTDHGIGFRCAGDRASFKPFEDAPQIVGP